ncbi:lantibiotic dehydratase [Streptomyces sp. NPDC041068]|uniref:lantibiotic dehydratase n=1 Tax=Streptomyces sp. NPDC041068 TaxID=3155130 RepID=UPI0033E9575D
MLLRTAGLPMRLWCAGGSPDLFRLISELERTEGDFTRMSARLADVIGTALVPHPALTVTERRLALSARRRLHRGRPLAEADHRRLVAVARRVTPEGALARVLTGAHAEAGVLEGLRKDVARRLDAEKRRLAPAGYALLRGSPMGRQALLDGTLPVGAEVAERLAAGRPWTDRQMRKRADYLWRMIARGAVKVTPRGWLGHVAVVGVADGPAGPARPLTLTADVATDWTENLQERSVREGAGVRGSGAASGDAASADSAEPDPAESDPANPGSARPEDARPEDTKTEATKPEAAAPEDAAADPALPGDASPPGSPALLDAATRVSFNPFLRVASGHLEALALEPGDDTLLTPVRIRRTPLVNRLHSALRRGAVPLGELESALVPPSADAGQRAVLRQFLLRLAEMGVLQLRPPTRQRRRPWHAATPEHTDDTPIERVDGGYLDVYRRMPGALPGTDLMALRAAIGQALRLHALMDEDAETGPAAAPDFVTGQDRSILNILRDRLAATGDTPVSVHVPAAEWPEPRTPGSGYARLVDWLDSRIDDVCDGASIDIGRDVLDRFGAPEARPAWPLDCVVRPLPGPNWALDVTVPAGVYDARFVGALERLHGRLPQVEAYRAFLRRLDRESGVPSVELLFPALSRFAANAVRRPLYTGSWTGDPDLPGYCEGPPGARPRFVPLDELTARWNGTRVVVSDRSGPIRPLYHSARNAPRPWDQVASLLLGASPQHSARRRRLRHSLGALPKREYVPRITVAGSLVLSAAQWRVPVAALPPTTAHELDRARHLTRLRERLGLPRWVFLSAASGADSPLPCDLESLHALSVLERTGDLAFAAGGTAVAEEMLPSPSELLVADLADPAGAPVTAELLVRIHRSV